MPSLGMQEIIVLFIIALIIFGPRKLPELGKTLGKGLSEFKKASNDLKRAWEEEVELEKEKNAMKDLLQESTAALTGPAAEISKELKDSTDALQAPLTDLSKELQESTSAVTEPAAEMSKELNDSTDVLQAPVADYPKELQESENDLQESVSDYSKETR